jgi:hypothetical protein
LQKTISVEFTLAGGLTIGVGGRSVASGQDEAVFVVRAKLIGVILWWQNRGLRC